MACTSSAKTTSRLRYKLRLDDRLRAAVRGDAVRINQTQMQLEVPKTMLRPKEIQARIRAGASVEQLACAADVDVSRIMRFAHPVLLERARAAELATASHPVLEDGPSVLTLLETVTTALVSRGLDPDETQWDAWRNEDGRWTVQVGWKAGRSDNLAHFRYSPGAHGGTVTAVDEPASELIDPRFERPLRVAPMAQLDFDIPDMIVIAEPKPKPEPEPRTPAGARTGARRKPARARRAPSTPSDTQRQARAAGRAGVGGRAARGAVQRRPLTNLRSRYSAPVAPSASSAIHATETPTPAPNASQRTTGVLRHPHTVGARPPTATRLRPAASSG